MFKSVVIPIYNESSCLAENLETVHDCLGARFGSDYEIIGVDDGSTDDSLQILNRLKKKIPLVVLNHKKNQGKGAAIRKGMLAARGDAVLFFDADLSTSPEEVFRFIPYLSEGLDVVVGNRKSFKARIKKMQPPHRILMGLGYSCLVNLILGTRFSDFTCGFKAFSRRAVDTIFPRTKIDGWSFDVELLYLAHRMGLRILELPITWENKPGSKVSLVKDTIRSFTEVLKVKKLHRTVKNEAGCLQNEG